MTNDERAEVFADTFDAIQNRYYVRDGLQTPLTFSKSEMEEGHVYLPNKRTLVYEAGKRPAVKCENKDSFVMAREMLLETGERPLVLNMASPIHPGGGVRTGSSAQEEELCRRSTLIASLEGKDARKYYNYNRSSKSKLGTDAVLISPNVEVLKGKDYAYLDETFAVSVITCAAPNIRNKNIVPAKSEYRDLVRKRISAMLAAAKEEGYKDLVLGAWGCGVFRNDPNEIASLFADILFASSAFQNVWFAVLDKTDREENYRAFKKVFG